MQCSRDDTAVPGVVYQYAVATENDAGRSPLCPPDLGYVTGDDTHVLMVRKGWNLVAVPTLASARELCGCTRGVPTVREVFGGACGMPGWLWRPELRAYVPVTDEEISDTLAYWLFAREQSALVFILGQGEGEE